MQTIANLIKAVGVSSVAKACGVSDRAVYKWLKNGSLPATEFFGGTNYASTIESISDGKCSAKDLLNVSKEKLMTNKKAT